MMCSFLMSYCHFVFFTADLAPSRHFRGLRAATDPTITLSKNGYGFFRRLEKNEHKKFGIFFSTIRILFWWPKTKSMPRQSAMPWQMRGDHEWRNLTAWHGTRCAGVSNLHNDHTDGPTSQISAHLVSFLGREDEKILVQWSYARHLKKKSHTYAPILTRAGLRHNQPVPR